MWSVANAWLKSAVVDRTRTAPVTILHNIQKRGHCSDEVKKYEKIVAGSFYIWAIVRFLAHEECNCFYVVLGYVVATRFRSVVLVVGRACMSSSI